MSMTRQHEGRAHLCVMCVVFLVLNVYSLQVLLLKLHLITLI